MERGVFFLLVAVLLLVAGRVMWASYLNYRNRVMYHRERMFALEKGVEVPAMPPGLAAPPAEGWLSAQAAPASRSAHLFRGLVWLFLGIGITVFFAGISATSVREQVPMWFYSQPAEQRKYPPPVVSRYEVPIGWATLGVIPACVGVAYLIFYGIEGRKRREQPPEQG